MTSDFWSRRRRPAKTAADHHRERRARRRRQLAAEAAFPVTVEMIADRDNLYRCYLDLRREGGQAPGADGLRYPDLSPGEVGDLLADLSRRVQTHVYRPQPARLVVVRKPGTDRTRTLSIPAVLDRVVAKALADALSPWWEEVFLDCSWGFRPGRNAWKMLLAVERTAETTGYAVLAIDDLKTAFDTVPADAVQDAHRQLLAHIERAAPEVIGRTQVTRRDAMKMLLWLVEAVLWGGSPARGIPQGNNYSPTALNAVLHHYLDEPISHKLKRPLWHRYADNLCRLCRSVTGGENALAAIRRKLAPTGMSLKGEDGVSDLKAGGEAQLLGFTLSHRKGRLVYGLGKRARDQLRRGLEGAYENHHPERAAKRSLDGWIASYGPALETGKADVASILTAAAECGFRELASPREVRRLVRGAREDWARVRERTTAR